VVADLEAKLGHAGVEVLVDDRDERPGAKFAAMDLIGLPFQAVVGPRGVKEGKVELKERATGERAELSPDALLQRFAG
jgi:prolyl-tRNA synthetase